MIIDQRQPPRESMGSRLIHVYIHTHPDTQDAPITINIIITLIRWSHPPPSTTSATGNNTTLAVVSLSRITKPAGEKGAEGLALLYEGGQIYKEEVDLANATGEVSQSPRSETMFLEALQLLREE